jgi:hypothetical protein
LYNKEVLLSRSLRQLIKLARFFASLPFVKLVAPNEDLAVNLINPL